MGQLKIIYLLNEPTLHFAHSKSFKKMLNRISFVETIYKDKKMYVINLILCILLVFSACSKENSKADSEQVIDSLGWTEAEINQSNLCGELETIDPSPKDALKVEEEKSRFESIKEKLKTGLTAHVHGSVPQYSYYVINYGTNILESIQFNLISFDPKVLEQLKDLKRHDKISIKGQILENRSPVKHIVVESFEITEPYEFREEYGIEYDKELLQDFSSDQSKKILAKVHAVIADGKALVLDYKNAIIPVFIEPEHYELTKNLYRNDKLVAEVRPLAKARGPLHLILDKDSENPIRVVDKMVNCHGIQRTIEGVLTMFYKSPQITVNVFAVKQKDPNGLERNFTFFPDYDPEKEFEQFMNLFNQIQAKLMPIWEKNEDQVEKDRNSLFNPQLKVRVSGRMNVVSKSQANPQIYIKIIEAIEVIYE